ncbi:type VI secretion system-associated protein TagF [Pseudoduganella sp. OTU4001]|uniref:type VI secretion system-associated protein TagF n=1 Tax=Pseudoduganella sp. OTU4001 TaxID=3043854 RepID=UPI00313A8667
MSGPALAPAIAGWYGKLPALGDFASRRLPQPFIDQWDAWLQRGLAASRASLQERWEQVYLNGPLWNFALLNGACGERAWAGAVMPSVDKVGRHFPLTIALELAPAPSLLANLLAAHSWFAAIDEVALACLDVNVAPEQLEQQLAQHPFPSHLVPPQGAMAALGHWWTGNDDAPIALALAAGETLHGVFTGAALDRLARSGGARSIWWTAPAPNARTLLLAFPGMPNEVDFALLLEGAAAYEPATRQ